MNISPIKTHTITSADTDIFKILDTYLPELQEQTIVAVTSKIVSITQGRVVPVGEADKDKLIEEESEYYLPREENPYGVSFTITNGTLAASAGIDESNADGKYVLWPKDPQESANAIREHLAKSKGLREVGVIITDSRTMPMLWGVTGMTIGYSGFTPLKDYIGTPDLFGRDFVFEKLNVADSLAAAATVVMGEGNESTPIAIISDVSFVQFQDRNPTEEELASLRIDRQTDLYAPFLNSAPWRKGRGNKS
jgi:dihydrofolate synthase / folylpolyglutamate synthase